MINTDLSIQRPWVARRSFNNPFTLTFTASSVAFDVSTYTFVVNIRRVGATTNLIQLTQGSGITNGGASGIVSIQLSAANTELIGADSYFYEINYTVSALQYGLLHGTFSLLSNYNNENIENSVDIDVSLSGTDVNMAITLATDALTTRVRSTTSTATLTPNVSLYDMDVITAQAEALTIANPTGTPSNGNGYVLRIKDNGTARAITFGDKYNAIGSALPTTTTISKTIYIPFVYNSTSLEYDCFPSQLEV